MIIRERRWIRNGDVFIWIVKMFLVRLCLLVCVNLFLYAKCSIPVEKLCVNPTCEEPISKAQGKIKYIPQSREALAFEKGEEIYIVSKSKNKQDYWGAIIRGKSGYVPSLFVKEVRIFHAEHDLKPVTVETSQDALTSTARNNTSDEDIVTMEKPNMSEPTESVVGIPQSPKPPLETLEAPIQPHEPYKIIEGTTIYADETGEIKPSATTDGNSAGQTVNPISPTINSKHDVEERATIPPEVINLNAKYKGESKQKRTAFVIENVHENDENAKVESRDIDEDEDEDEEDDGDGGDDDEDEADDDLADEMQEILDNKISPDQFHEAEEGAKTESDAETEGKLKEMVAAGSIETNTAQTVAPIAQTSAGSGVNTGTDNSKIMQQSPAESLPQPSPQDVGVNKVDKPPMKPPSTWSMLNNYKELNTPSRPSVEGFQVNYGIPRQIRSGPPEPVGTSLNQESISAQSQAVLTESQPVPLQPHKSAPSQATLPQEHAQSEAPAVEQMTAGTTGRKTEPHKLTTEVSDSTPLNAADSIPNSVSSTTAEEAPAETFVSTPQPVASETSTIFSQFSASAGSLLEGSSSNAREPSLGPETIQEKVEVTTEAFATSHVVPTETTKQYYPYSDSTQIVKVLNPSDEIPSESAQKTDDPAAEPPVPPSVLPEALKEEAKPEEDLSVTDQGSNEGSATGGKEAEESSTSSGVMGMVSSWFSSAPAEDETYAEGEVNHEAAYPDLQPEGKPGILNRLPLSGKCSNGESGSDCAESVSEEQPPFWSSWMPSGLGGENVLTARNTFTYLVVTAVTVLVFTLGHNLIEKKGKTGPLIAKINKLEHELLVSSKECLMLKDDMQSLREKIVLYENSANDELVLSLQAELEESKKVKSELESSIEVLQQELDAATEAGLDLNKMLSEVLTQKGGSESLLKSIESLQAQLDCQQNVIDEMTNKLGVKNQENEALQTALEAANEKSESLEEQLGEIKHNLNLHLKEKEDLTRYLNSQINQLKIRISQLGESKEKDVSKLRKELEDGQKKYSECASALTVKEEELKALKESMKHLKGKGDVKVETVFDISRVKGELAKEVKEKQALTERLEKEESSKKALVEQMKAFEDEVQKLRKGYEDAEQKKVEAEKKLEVLSTYFKEKETQLQKELGLQEALWAQKKGDEKAVYNMMKSLQEEVESYKSQNETLKKEIFDQERGLKNQIATLEQKAHENWVAARQAERKLEETKQEMAQLRNRLTLMEKNSSNAEGKPNLRSSEELNGVEATSPILHDTSSPLLFPPLSLDHNASSLLPPGFMPPPIFMPPPLGGFIPPPPFLPGDRRPPPLGRMSSPPLNNRFSPSSPPDYPFERMSSPPLSPPATNYRSPNEDRDHYRHRTPPFPPPLHLRNWDDGNDMPGFIPISSQRDARRDHKGSNVSSKHSSSESLDKSSRHSGRV